MLHDAASLAEAGSFKQVSSGNFILHVLCNAEGYPASHCGAGIVPKVANLETAFYCFFAVAIFYFFRVGNGDITAS